jgi:peptide/nickel transport system ATP-binding protein
MEKILKVEDLKVSFHTYAGEVQSVRGISFDLNKGETLAIVGESGSGKTVTAKSILRLIKGPIGEIKENSKIVFNGKNILDFGKKELEHFRGGEVSMIFQDPMTSLNPTMKVGKQIAESIMIHRNMKKEEAEKEAVKMLKLVKIPNAEMRAMEYPHQFSGGMRQRAMIAIALACNPKILIADEPTTALDVTVQAQIMGLMRELQEELGTAIVLITHDLGVVADSAQKVAVMYGGKIIEKGLVEEIFYNPQHPYTSSLLKAIPKLDMDNKEKLTSIEGTPPDLVAPPKGCPFAPRCKHCMPICKRKQPSVTDITETHSTMCWLQHEYAPKVDLTVNLEQTGKNTDTGSDNSKIIQASRKLEPLIEVKNLKKYFKVSQKDILKAVDNVSFTINKGETLGVVGESGCGKTTCGRTVLGLYDATEGESIFEGRNIYSMSKEERIRFTQKAQMIFQDPYASLNPRMTVADIVAEGIDIHGIYKGKDRLERVYELLNMVGLNKEHANRFPHEFSGGQRQRVGIARALSVNPKFIVCDEPISALDMSIQAQVVNLLIDLQNKFDLTYMFIAHDLSMVKYISDRVAVMYLGSMVELADSKELYKNPLHPYTKTLMSAIPIPNPIEARKQQKILDDGEIPSPINPPPGCRFKNRCRYAKKICSEAMPSLKEVGNNHYVACHLF